MTPFGPRMAYLIISTGGEEVGRRELATAAAVTAPIVIGRAADCDISVHDILLSRKHCRLEPSGSGGWTLVDLDSKNGTFVGGSPINRYPLVDGDEVQVGKTRITIRAGSLIPPPLSLSPRRPARPVDPQEAMAGTVSGLTFVEPAPPPMSPLSLPTPKPRPSDPPAFARDDIYSMLEEIASSSWDSIYAVNALPLQRERRTLPRPIVQVPGEPNLPPGERSPQRPRVSLSLQLVPAALIDAPQVPASVEEAAAPQIGSKRQSSVARLARRARVRLARVRRWMSMAAVGVLI